MEVDYRHTWSLSNESWILRAYVWLWDANPEGATFCKMFWGYVLAPIALLLRLGEPALKAIARRRVLRDAEKAKRPPALSEETPHRVSVFFARPRVRTVSRIVGIAVLVVLGCGVLGLLVYAIITDPLGVLLVFGIVIGSLAVIGVGAWFASMYESGGLQGLRRFGRFMLAGAVAVKANTCPRIEVEKKELAYDE